MKLTNVISNYLSAISNYGNIDAEDGFPENFFSVLRANDLLKATLPGKHGGKSLPTAAILGVLKAAGKKNLSGGRIFEGHINAVQLILLFAKAPQRQKWLQDIEEQKLFGVWNTQAKDGVTILDEGNGIFRLEGSKTFCSGAGFIQRPVITAEWISPNFSGWQMFILPTEKIQPIKCDPDFWRPLGMKGSVSYRMEFTGIEITAEDLLGQPGDYYKQPYFSGGAARFASVQLGGAEAILTETHEALKLSGRTTQPFQQGRMAEMVCLIETGNLWIKKAGEVTDAYQVKKKNPDLQVAYANMTRTIIEEICLKVMLLAEKSVGSQAFMHTSSLEQLHRDLTTYLRQPAPDAALIAIGAYAFEQKSMINMWETKT